jgi:hypothetical protein
MRYSFYRDKYLINGLIFLMMIDKVTDEKQAGLAENNLPGKSL